MRSSAPIPHPSGPRSPVAARPSTPRSRQGLDAGGRALRTLRSVGWASVGERPRAATGVRGGMPTANGVEESPPKRGLSSCSTRNRLLLSLGAHSARRVVPVGGDVADAVALVLEDPEPLEASVLALVLRRREDLRTRCQPQI